MGADVHHAFLGLGFDATAVGGEFGHGGWNDDGGSRFP